MGGVHNTVDRGKRKALSIGGHGWLLSQPAWDAEGGFWGFPISSNQASHVRMCAPHTDGACITYFFSHFQSSGYQGRSIGLGPQERSDLSEQSMSLRDRFVPNKDLLILSSSDHTLRLLASRYDIPLFVLASFARETRTPDGIGWSRWRNRAYRPSSRPNLWYSCPLTCCCQRGGYEDSSVQ